MDTRSGRTYDFALSVRLERYHLMALEHLLKHAFIGAFIGVGLLCGTAVAAESGAGVPRIGIVELERAERPSPRIYEFEDTLRRLGHVEGRSFAVERRWWGFGESDLSALVADLLRARVDILVVKGPATRHVRHVKHIPVLFSTSADPLAAGITRSLSRPDGNMTGFTWMSFEINVQRLQLVKETFPQVTRVAILSNPGHPGEPVEIEMSRSAARQLGLQIDYHPVRTTADTDAALAAIREARAGAIIGIPDGLLRRHAANIGEFALSEKIPLIYGWSDWIHWGALMTLGPDRRGTVSRLAHYADRILKGAKPSDLPIERPSRFELVINLQTATALGISLPQSLLLRADNVIE